MATPLPSRPAGVTVLAALALIVALFALFAAFAIFAAGALAGAAVNSSSLVALGAAGGVLVLAYALFAAAVAWGLFARRRWAWYACVGLAALNVVFGLLTLLGAAFVGGLAQLVLAGVAAWYLLSPPVQRWFGVAYAPPWTYRERAVRPPGST